MIEPRPGRYEALTVDLDALAVPDQRQRPEGLLGANELVDRVYRVFGCPHYEHLSVLQ